MEFGIIPGDIASRNVEMLMNAAGTSLRMGSDFVEPFGMVRPLRLVGYLIPLVDGRSPTFEIPVDSDVISFRAAGIHHFRVRPIGRPMSEDVPDRDEAIEISAKYADSECVGQFDEVTEIEERDTEWIVEFRTHTLFEAYIHCVRITKSVGNVVSHDRSSRFD